MSWNAGRQRLVSVVWERLLALRLLQLRLLEVLVGLLLLVVKIGLLQRRRFRVLLGRLLRQRSLTLLAETLFGV